MQVVGGRWLVVSVCSSDVRVYTYVRAPVAVCDPARRVHGECWEVVNDSEGCCAPPTSGTGVNSVVGVMRSITLPRVCPTS